jgi:SMC interacting uncharacterized protein involved in chromosome segregation
MELIEQITRKTEKIVLDLAKIKKENRQLISEVEILRQQLTEQKKSTGDFDQLTRERERLRSKLERVSKKLDKLLQTDPVPAGPASEGGE